jgi:hypothetical protein
MDGGTHNDPFNNLNLPTPFPDALQEFKVETSALPARYGHHASSAVKPDHEVRYQHAAWQRLRIPAQLPFQRTELLRPDPRQPQAQPVRRRRGRSRREEQDVLFGGYQGKVEKTNPATNISFVPTAAMRAGDFTEFASPACNGGRQVTLGGGFVGNRIDPSPPQSRSVAMLKYLPVPTDPCGRITYGIPDNNTEHQGLGKVDYNLTANQTMFARYMYAVYENPATFDGQNALTLSRTGQKNQVHSLVYGHNYVLAANKLNAFHFTYNTTINDRPLPEYFTATDLGSKVVSPLKGYVGIAVNGNGFSFGNGGTNPGYFNSRGFQIADDFDMISGAHQLSFGGNWIRTRIETLNNRPTNGAFTFNGQTTGLGLADFMIGSVSNFLQGNPVYDYDHNDYVGAYVQDSWRVTSNLSVNAGIRWEPFLPIKNTYSWVSHFERAAFDAGKRSTVYPQAPAGLSFPATTGIPAMRRRSARRPSSRRGSA